MTPANQHTGIERLSDELLPCPFCGSPGRVMDHHHHRNGEVWAVECAADCEMTPTCTKNTRAEAIAAWNRRTHPHSSSAVDGLTDGLAAIAAERQRQIEAEGWTPEHDDRHSGGELAHAAACYALGRTELRFEGVTTHFWPWDRSWWKPKDRIRDLVRAGALIAAEIDRLKRIAALAGGSNGRE